MATAIIALLKADGRRHPVYNVAAGETATIAELLDYTREKLPGLEYTLTQQDGPDVDYDPARRTGRWGAYDISRIHADTGWRPRPLRQSLHEYIDWLNGPGKPPP